MALCAAIITAFAVLFFKSGDDTVKTIGGFGVIATAFICCLAFICAAITTGPVPTHGVDYEATLGPEHYGSCREECYACCACPDRVV